MPNLSAVDPDSTGKLDKMEAQALNEKLLAELCDLLYTMFAENRRSLLIVLHGIDAAGKDGTVKHIFGGANPQGIRVYSFKQPSPEELEHDFLWRCHRLTPERGMATIFNRSYYEDVTTVRVHPELLADRNLPEDANLKKLFRQRYRQINEFEKMLSENGTVVLKFLLHISKEEQKERLEERLADPTKHWKFSPGDLKERKFWDEYMRAFAQMVKETDTEHAPWRIVPANKKWYRNYLVTETIVKALRAQKMMFPKLKSTKPKIE